MPSKNDIMRHKRNVKNRKLELKKRYMKLTQNDTIEPDKALAVLKDSEQVELIKRLADKLARRGVFVRFAEQG